jgi:hypothetical protein
MDAKRSSCFILVIILTSIPLLSDEPTRKGGLSAHLQPDRIGRMMGETGGFDVRPHHDIEERRLFPTAKELFIFFKKRPSQVQANGIWVVMTHPSAYSEDELKQLDILADLCKAEDVPLFVARASELPDGWKRRN